MKNGRRQMAGYRNSRNFNQKPAPSSCNNRNTSHAGSYNNYSSNSYFHPQNSDNFLYGNCYYDERGPPPPSQPNNPPPQYQAPPPFSISNNSSKLSRGYSRDVSANSDSHKRCNNYERSQVVEPPQPSRPPPLPQSSSARESNSTMIVPGPPIPQSASETYRTVTSNAVTNHIPPPPPPTTASYVASTSLSNSTNAIIPTTDSFSFFPIKTELVASAENEQPSKYFASDPFAISGANLQMPATSSFLNYNSVPHSTLAVPYVNLDPVNYLGYNAFNTMPAAYTYQLGATPAMNSLDPYLSSTFAYQQQLQQLQQQQAAASLSYEDYCHVLYEKVMKKYELYRVAHPIVPTQTILGLLPLPEVVCKISSLLPYNMQLFPPMNPGANAQAAMSFRPNRGNVPLTELPNPIIQYGCSPLTSGSFLNVKNEVTVIKDAHRSGEAAPELTSLPSSQASGETSESRNGAIDSPGLLLNRDLIGAEESSSNLDEQQGSNTESENIDVKWNKDFASEFMNTQKGTNEPSVPQCGPESKETSVKSEAEESDPISTSEITCQEKVRLSMSDATKEVSTDDPSIKLEPFERHDGNNSFCEIPQS